MTVRIAYKPITSQVTVTVLTLAVCSLLVIAGFGLYAMILADRDALETERTFLVAGMAERQAETQREQESVTVWDDAVTAVKQRDLAWTEENLTAWMFSYYGHDRVYVLDEFDDPVQSMVDGKIVQGSEFEKVRPTLSPLLDELRLNIMRSSSGNDDGSSRRVGGVLNIGSLPAIVSIMPIVPSTTSVKQEPGTEYLHVSVQAIDDMLVQDVASKYQIKGAHYVSFAEKSDTSTATIPLVSANGTILGHIGWERSRPGLTFVLKVTPALALGVLLAGGILGFLIRRLRHTYTQLEKSRNETEFLAFHDTLTGLPNRALFEDRLHRAHVDRRRAGSQIALLYIDLDRFKLVNDTLGHPAGDELVRQAAGRLKATARPADTVARLGGDEFAIIMEGLADLGPAADLSEDILEAMARPFTLMGDQVHIGASIGVAMGHEADPDHAELLRKADIALYEAKKKGRGRFEVFAGDMDQQIISRRAIESDLRAALESDTELGLVYQPIFGPDCVTIVGAEALMRWEHPTRGAMSPGQFIPIAEERGMMNELGSWLLRRACSFAAASHAPWMAVNVSPLQLREEGFADRVAAILDETGLAPHRLEIEITENVLLDSGGTTRRNLEQLRAMRVRVALDDFGTGYSSVNYLRRYGIDKLKVDRSFIHVLGQESTAAPIVRAIIELAKALKVTVTIEGIETPLQRDAVLAMGADELQGYLLSKPVSDLRLTALLAEQFDRPPTARTASATR